MICVLLALLGTLSAPTSVSLTVASLTTAPQNVLNLVCRAECDTMWWL